MRVLHDEKQPFVDGLWKGVVLLLSAGIFVLLYSNLEPELNGKIVIWSTLVGTLVLFNVLMWMARLHLQINSYSVRYRYPPFINFWRTIERETIASYKIKPYNWKNYGGWGLRYSMIGKGWAYTVFNKHILQIDRNTKQKISIGTHQPGKVKAAMEKMMEKSYG